MTPFQTKLYWHEWAAAHRAHPEADRHAFHVHALGRDKSSKDFSNADLDKILGAFRAVSQPANLAAQLDALLQPVKRLKHRIGQLAAPAYTAALMRDRFHTDALDSLTLEQLQQLRATLVARTYAPRAARGHPGRSTPVESGVPGSQSRPEHCADPF